MMDLVVIRSTSFIIGTLLRLLLVCSMTMTLGPLEVLLLTLLNLIQLLILLIYSIHMFFLIWSLIARFSVAWIIVTQLLLTFFSIVTV